MKVKQGRKEEHADENQEEGKSKSKSPKIRLIIPVWINKSHHPAHQYIEMKEIYPTKRKTKESKGKETHQRLEAEVSAKKKDRCKKKTRLQPRARASRQCFGALFFNELYS